MWTSERDRRLSLREAEAEVGVVTLGGDPAGVLVGGERRWLPVYSPGGYSWRPAEGDRVLVIKAGCEQESPCVLGKVQDSTQLKPGEVCLSGTGSSLVLVDGRLELNGRITVNGTSLENYIRSVASALLNSESGG